MNAYGTIVITIITILAPKLILNLRVAYYGPPEDIASDLTWNVHVSTSSAIGESSGGALARDELASFLD